MGFCLVLLIVLVYQSYQPYPVACLALGAVLALALVGLDTTFAVCLQTVIACGSLYLPFRNTTLGFALLVALLAAVSFRVVRSQSGCMAWSAAATLLVFLKWTLMLDQGPFSTLCWAAAAVGLLYYAVTHEELGRWNECNGGLFDYSRLLYFLSFVKAITFDTNFVGRLQPLEYPLTFLVGSLFLASGHLLIRKRDVRNLFLVLGLMICCFQLTFILHSWWGDRMYFQPLLSGFWSAVSLVVIAIGISLNLKVYRLFGLVMLVANTAKILLVDIHVLDSYSQTNTFLILGVLLMTTSFLYHRRREDLCPERSAARLCVTS